MCDRQRRKESLSFRQSLITPCFFLSASVVPFHHLYLCRLHFFFKTFNTSADYSSQNNWCVQPQASNFELMLLPETWTYSSVTYPMLHHTRVVGHSLHLFRSYKLFFWQSMVVIRFCSTATPPKFIWESINTCRNNSFYCQLLFMFSVRR